MRVYITSVCVDDQAKAKAFYTEVLGFKVKHDIPVGEYSWLTLVAADQEQGPEVLLEPPCRWAVPFSTESRRHPGNFLCR